MLCAEPMERDRAIELSSSLGDRSRLVSWSWGGSGGEGGSRVLLTLMLKGLSGPSRKWGS